MKIIQFIRNLSTGGAESLVKDYAIELSKRGHTVLVVVLERNPSYPNELALKDATVPVVCLEGRGTRGSNPLKRIGQSYKKHRDIAKRLSRVIDDFQPDILHFHLNLERFVYLVRKDLKCTRIFYTCHNTPKLYFGKNGFWGLVDRRCFLSLVRDHGLSIIALHEDMAYEIKEAYGFDSTVVKNPVNLSRFKFDPGIRESYREELGIPEGSFVVGHVGRFSDAKNHAWLIKVFSKLCNQNSNAYLLMVGDGPRKEESIQQLISLGLDGRYTILSNRKDVPELLMVMDVFCFPSLWEGYPISLLEAQAVGLRCVVSDNVTNEAIVTEGNSRLSLDEPEDRWVEAICSGGIEIAVPRQGNALVSYSIDSVINSLLSLYGLKDA